MDRYQVVAPYVTVATMTQRGQQVIGLGKGAFVPEDAPSEWVKRHLRKKMIEKVPALDTPAPAPASAPQQEDSQGKEVPSLPPAAPPAPASDERQAPPEGGPGSGKQAWEEYAVARGMDPKEAKAMSRDDLIATYKE